MMFIRLKIQLFNDEIGIQQNIQEAFILTSNLITYEEGVLKYVHLIFFTIHNIQMKLEINKNVQERSISPV